VRLIEQFDLIVVGEAPLDILLDKNPSVKRPGGVMYSASAAVVAGAKVGVVCQVGHDEIGGFLPILEKLPIDIKGITRISSPGINYLIRNSDEVLPQLVTSQNSQYFPREYNPTPQEYYKCKALLLYPTDQKLLEDLATTIHSNCGKVYFDLQHDIKNIKDWRTLFQSCDVIFASWHELLAYTGQNTEYEAVKVLRELGASTIVIKYGIGGSVIYEKDTGEQPIRLPGYLANFKCTIGAGDVYNAIFAVEFSRTGSYKEAGSKAAIAASIFTEYFNFDDYFHALQNLYAEFDDEARRRFPVIAPPERLASIQLYLAGHFLSTPMRIWVDMVTQSLELRGFSIFSPYRDAGILDKNSSLEARQQCFLEDVVALDHSKAIVALLDGLGRGGTSWEIGYGYAKNIPVYGLQTDMSQPISNMVEQSCQFIETNLSRLINELLSFASEEIARG
jgi:sugar/nucleoside kinase (ribokinase family)/nucleoside 2-deoxyribosyltransferase